MGYLFVCLVALLLILFIVDHYEGLLEEANEEVKTTGDAVVYLDDKRYSGEYSMQDNGLMFVHVDEEVLDWN